MSNVFHEKYMALGPWAAALTAFALIMHRPKVAVTMPLYSQLKYGVFNLKKNTKLNSE
jgi:hypothetical protein